MPTCEQYLRPDVARQVRRLDLRAKFIVEGFLAGLNDSPYRGFSLEFSEHRKYTVGDDPRTIDWTKWARTDRLYVKTYQAETNLEAYLLVDTSRSMAYGGAGEKGSGAKGSGALSFKAPDPLSSNADSKGVRSPNNRAPDPGVMTKLEYATALAAAIGYLLTRQQDAVGLGLLGTGLNKLLRPHTGRRQLVRILSELARTPADGRTALAPGLHTVARQVKRRGLMLLFSDLMDEPESVLEALRHLAFRGHDVVVFHILDAAERTLDFDGPVILEDPETGAEVATDADAIRSGYTARLEKFVAHYARAVQQLGGDFVPMTTSTPFNVALCRFLAERKRRF